MRRLIVGDIHGCWEELQDLLDRASLSAEDEVIALGDIVDRGPQSPQVFQMFQEQDSMRALLGNHERKHLRWFGGELQPALSQRITHHQLGDHGHTLACAYFSTLPPFIELEEAILIHGYLEPGVELEKQHISTLTGTLSAASYLAEQYDKPWYELWEGEKPVLVGHCDYSGRGVPTVMANTVFALDTNCCRGGALTGLLLPEFRFISVKARRNHYEHLMEDFLDFRLEEREDKKLKWDRIERLLELPKRRTRFSMQTAKRLRALRVLKRHCEELFAQIEDYVRKRAKKLLKQLEDEKTEWEKRELASRFSSLCGGDKLSSLLHRERLGKFSRNDVKRLCPTPEVLETIAATLVEQDKK